MADASREEIIAEVGRDALIAATYYQRLVGEGIASDVATRLTEAFMNTIHTARVMNRKIDRDGGKPPWETNA